MMVLMGMQARQISEYPKQKEDKAKLYVNSIICFLDKYLILFYEKGTNQSQLAYCIYNLIIIIQSQQIKMENTSEYLQQLSQINDLFDNNIRINKDNVSLELKTYVQVSKIFSSHANKLATLANNINQTVLKSSNQQQLGVQCYQMLSNSLLRLADCSRKVAYKCKTIVIDPLGIFNNLRDQLEKQLKMLTNLNQQLIKNRQSYNSWVLKYQKHIQAQNKIMQKIENGNRSQLQKLNLSTKKISQGVENCQLNYSNSIQIINSKWEQLQQKLPILIKNIAQNEQKRFNSFKARVVNTIQTFQELNSAYDKDFLSKMDEISIQKQNSLQQKNFKKMKILTKKLINNQIKLQFTKYQDEIKRKRKQSAQQQIHLTQYFKKLKEKDRLFINQVVKSLFNPQNSIQSDLSLRNKSIQQKTSQNQSSIKILSQKSQYSMQASVESENSYQSGLQCSILARRGNNCLQNIVGAQKIVQNQIMSFYLIEILSSRIFNMQTFYFKVKQSIFSYLLNLFIRITETIDTQSEIHLEFLYKIMSMSIRIVLKSNNNKSKNNTHIQLLSKKYGKSITLFNNPKVLARLLNSVEKRKESKKMALQNKGALNTIAKGLFAVWNYKKSSNLSQQDRYNCLQQIVKLISNFSVPNEVLLLFIKDCLGNHQQASYDYLKGVVLNKKDVQQRQSIFYKQQIRQRRESWLKEATKCDKVGVYAIKSIAQRGFFDKKDISLRCLCKQLKDIHLQILVKVKMPIEHKWIHLIPFPENKNYSLLKQQAIRNEIPVATQEVIILDIKRSFHLHNKILNQNTLYLMLKTYAYHHPDIAYCQGMNYLAGYIFIKTLDEHNSYVIFEYLMETRFKEIFIKEFEVLRVKMYQFERLLDIFHPQISQQFKRQSISSSCYMVPWLITVFASSYQYTASSYLIDFVWQRFIIWGWPQFFKFVLWIFSIYKSQLMELVYDKALKFLGQISRSQLLLADEKHFKDEFVVKRGMSQPNIGTQRYQIEESLLCKFVQEYKIDKIAQ